MSLNKLILNTLNKEKEAIFLLTFSNIFVEFYYFLMYDKQFMVYPLIVTAIFLVVYIIYKCFVYNNLYVFLNNEKQSPRYKIRDGYAFQDVLQIINEVHQSYISKIYNIQSKFEKKDKLLAEWIHNMKTSVAIIELAVEKGNDEILRDIAEENRKLQKNLEESLIFSRLQEFEKDYVPAKVNLKELVISAVNCKKRNFIYSNIFPKVKIGYKHNIYTDKKWTQYIIEQIITNSIKYSAKGKSILFYCKVDDKNITLCIKDEGIGIKKEEISRVFDAFFTGSNGRIYEKSSGIGLYMCKTICEMLNSEISIKSKEKKGTEVSITFHKCNV